jgi:hypothetical protein
LVSILSSAPVATGVDDARLAGLCRWNLALTVPHAAQAVAVLLLASSFAITGTSSFPAGPPGTAVPAPERLFDVGVGAAIAVFLGLAALDHLLTARCCAGATRRTCATASTDSAGWSTPSARPSWFC